MAQQDTTCYSVLTEEAYHDYLNGAFTKNELILRIAQLAECHDCGEKSASWEEVEQLVSREHIEHSLGPMGTQMLAPFVMKILNKTFKKGEK